jgi:hypothetical protein
MDIEYGNWYCGDVCMYGIFDVEYDLYGRVVLGTAKLRINFI